MYRHPLDATTKAAGGSMQHLKISDILVKTRGNQSEVARMLRINRGTLIRLMRQPEDRHIIVRSEEGDYYIYTRIGENV